MSEDPDFGLKARVIYKIIKLSHHLNNVTNQEEPPTISRIKTHLSNIIKPAVPNLDTQALIEGNAKNWAHTTMIILRDHYKDNLDLEMTKLKSLSTHDWRDSFEVALRWARRSIGRRLQNTTIHQVERLLGNNLDISNNPNETHTVTDQMEPQEGPLRPQINRSPVNTGTKGRLVTTSAVVHSVTTSGPSLGKTAQKKVQKLTQTVSTMTDSYHDWSPMGIEEREGIEDEPENWVVPPTPIPSHTTPPMEKTPPKAPPKKQRAKRTPLPKPAIKNPCVLLMEDEITAEDLNPSFDEEDLRPRSSTTTGIKPDMTPRRITRLMTATQSLLNMGNQGRTDTGSQNEAPTRRPTRHINTGRKMVDWSLCVSKKWLIIGDSNVSKFPPFTVPDLQIDSFPGATFRHAEAIIAKATLSTTVEKVIMSFGINNRSQQIGNTTIKQMQGALRTAKSRFPLAEIWVPEINFSGALPLKEQKQLILLNAHIIKNIKHIPALPRADFMTDPDNVHWTKDTAADILKHWCKHVK